MSRSDRVRTALVGYGYWGVNLARNIAAAPSLELVAVAESDTGRHEVIRTSYPHVSVYQRLDDVLADDAVEAVVLATPATMHGDMGLAVLESGRHLMVEKPLALSVDAAQRIVKEGDSRRLVTMVGHTFIYAPPVLRLRDAVISGELGEVKYLYSQRLSLGKIRRDCNALWNFAPHDISIMLYLLGELPTEVSARSFSFIQPGVADVFFATLQFPSGIGANIHVSWIDPRKSRLLTVVGDRKMAQYDDVSPDQKIWLFDAGVARSTNPSLGDYETMGEFQWRTRAGDIVIPKIAMEEPLLRELDTFGACVRDGSSPPTDGRHGLEVVRILDAIDSSAAARGAPVALTW